MNGRRLCAERRTWLQALKPELWMQAVKKSGQLQENSRSAGKRLSPGWEPNKSCWGKINISAGCHSEILLLSWYFPVKPVITTEASCSKLQLLITIENWISVQEQKKVSKEIPQILLKTRKHHLHDLLNCFILKTCSITSAVEHFYYCFHPDPGNLQDAQSCQPAAAAPAVSHRTFC